MKPAGTRTPDNRSSRLLPPITNEEASSVLNPRQTIVSNFLKPSSSDQRVKMWSKYHSGCINKSPNLGESTNKSAKKKNIDYNDGLEVMHFLDCNKDFLEAYVIESVPMEVLERWFFRKLKYNFIDNKPLDHGKPPNIKQTDTNTLSSYVNIVKSLQNNLSEYAVIWELAKTITMSVGVDAYRIYKIFPDHPSMIQASIIYAKLSPEKTLTFQLERADPEQVILVLDVAKKMSCTRVSRHEDPLRFPTTSPALFKAFKIKNVKEANHILYQPILSTSGNTGYVIEMWRVKDRFRERDKEISSNYMLWGSLALYYCNMYIDKKRERNMSDFLLDVVKAIFEEMVSLDQLIKRILEFAQRLVNADRASLFLVDYRNFELVSTVFDLKFEPGQDRDLEKKEIRMPINRGIAGHVALSGETMNIPDAYSDHRFNREVDEATGYKTISILCMPIKVEGKVIGVVQMVNKRDDNNFGRDDEVSFEIFSTFFGLALHHARLYDRIMRKEQKYRVALEVLSYHNTCRENEVQALLDDPGNFSINLIDFTLDPYKYDEFQKCKSVITMFDDLFGIAKFDVMTLTRFVLTVKKNYRTVPYHNFDHGWSVAHAMYVILKNDTEKRFDYTRRLALFVASLCHDLDHRGYTNKYMSETASPLAAMYTTSTLEHHHFNITVTILQQDGHNIFSHISSEEYKEILGYIRQAILATDLAAFFPNLEKMKDLHKETSQKIFNWSIPSHSDLAMAISMTAADLSASAKPWKVQIKTVKVIFEEFYDQGDKERAAGKTPIPMMDRNKPNEQPASQVGFLSQICIPCYTMLVKILPNTEFLYTMAKKNLDRWSSRAENIAAVNVKENLDQIYEENWSDSESTKFEDQSDLLEENQSEESENSNAVYEDITEAIVDSDISKNQTDNNKLQNIDTISWEEVEDTIPDSIAECNPLNGAFWKEGDCSWIDEEGVVIKTKVIKGIVQNTENTSIIKEKFVDTDKK